MFKKYNVWRDKMKAQEKASEINKRYSVLPLSLRIETLGGVATPLILRYTPLPAKRTQEFSTADDNQESIEIKVLAGESSLAENNKLIGKLTLKDIPKAPRGETRIEVTFEVDNSYKINVSAKEKKNSVMVDSHFDSIHELLTSSEIENLINLAEKNRKQDDDKLKKIEIENHVKKVLFAAEKKVNDPAFRLKDINKKIADLGKALAENDYELMLQKANELELIVSPFSGFNDVFEQIFGNNLPISSQKSAKKQETKQYSSKPPIANKANETGREGNIRDINIFHPLVIATAGNLFRDGYYRQAILDTYIMLIDQVKIKSGRKDLDGTGLVQTVFSPNNPLLKVSNNRDEQQGFMWLFSGAVMAIRNPKAHRMITQTDPQRTYEWLAFASVLLRVLDNAHDI